MKTVKSTMKLSKYLERIEYKGMGEPNVATLVALHEAHVCSVPFENLDVQLGRTLSTLIEDAYEKIVNNARGGWCYEQNGLFGWALSEIGFGVTRIAASVMREQKGAASNASHLCLLVTSANSETSYLTDVGFGGSMIRPIPLREAEYDQPPFKIGLERLDDRYWRYWESQGEGKFSFDFIEEPACEVALAKKCENLQNDPTSNFVLNLVAQQRSPGEHRMVRGRVLSVARAAGTESRMMASSADLVETLRHEFRLDVHEVAALWPKIIKRHEALFGPDSSQDQS
jgi:N-hydroxyarylamine O-acetyltransferase